MGLNIGTAELDNLMLGNQQVDRVMLGTAEVWSNNPGKEKLYHATTSALTKLDAATMSVISAASNPTGYTDVACVQKKLLVGYFGSTGSNQGFYQLNQATLSVIGSIQPAAMKQYGPNSLGGSSNYFFGSEDDTSGKPMIYDPETYVKVKGTDSENTRNLQSASGQGDNGYLCGDDDYDDGYTRHAISVWDLSGDTVTRTKTQYYEDGLWVQDTINGASPATETRLFMMIGSSYVRIDPATLLWSDSVTALPGGLTVSKDEIDGGK